MGTSVVQVDNWYARYDNGIGILAYDSFCGLVYAIAEKNDSFRNLLDLNNNKLKIQLKKIISNYLPSDTQLLPDTSSWPGSPQEKLIRPLIINWLITQKCTYRCLYCYATDVINNPKYSYAEFSRKEIAHNIIKQNPLAVVISGGEPFSLQKIDESIQYLAGKTGIIIDTNGVYKDEIIKVLPLLKKYNIHVRVSLDTLRVKKVYKTRPPIVNGQSEADNLQCIFESLTALISNNIHLTIQTVVTKKNANDLKEMGDKLWKMKVRSWRLLDLQDNPNNEKYKTLLMFDGNAEHIYKRKGFHFNKLLSFSQKDWTGMQLVRTPATGDRNNVVLVLPDGKFYTQGKNRTGKILIDQNSPYLPSENAYSTFSWGDHFERYIH